MEKMPQWAEKLIDNNRKILEQLQEVTEKQVSETSQKKDPTTEKDTQKEATPEAVNDVVDLIMGPAKPAQVKRDSLSMAIKNIF